MKSNINKKPINVYWSPEYDLNKDWSFLYQKPVSLFSDLYKNKTKTKKDSFFSCPALSNKFKKTLVFKNSLSSSYIYDLTTIKGTSDNYIGAVNDREPSVSNNPIIAFLMSYYFFSEESINVSLTSPYFHEPQYTKYGSIIPGEFDIGNWLRPYVFETQMWNEKGEFHLKEDEPIFYAEFKTDRPINLYRFNNTEKINRLADACINTTDMFGVGQSLFLRYNRFKKVGLREKVLTEIKNNLINEEPYKF